MDSILIAALVAAATLTAPDTPRFAEIRLANGVRIHYAEQGPATGQPVILLHGYSDSWFSFSRVLSGLSRDARVYALDLRGHGNSDRPADGYHMRDLASDVIAFMDAKGIARAAVVGHSMGSFVAQHVALAAPGRVSHLVLVGSGRSPRDLSGMNDLAREVNAQPDPVSERFAREFQLSTIHANVDNAFVDRAVAESRKLPKRVWRELMAGMLATGRAVPLGRSGIPTLVIRGDKDAIATAAETDSLAAMVSATVTKTYLSTGHAVHWERPAKFVADVRAFIEPARTATR